MIQRKKYVISVYKIVNYAQQIETANSVQTPIISTSPVVKNVEQIIA